MILNFEYSSNHLKNSSTVDFCWCLFFCVKLFCTTLRAVHSLSSHVVLDLTYELVTMLFTDFSNLNNHQDTSVILTISKVKKFWLNIIFPCAGTETWYRCCYFPSVILVIFYYYSSRKMSLGHLLITMMLSMTLILKRKLWK